MRCSGAVLTNALFTQNASVTATCLAFRLGKLFSMAWQVILYSAFGCTPPWMGCVAMGGAVMGCAAMHSAVFRAICVVTAS